MPNVFVHKDLLSAMGQTEARELKEQFLDWLDGDEFEHPLFGKDSAFAGPKSAVDAGLRHVHLIPLVNLLSLERWNAGKRRRPPSQVTSNRVLVYTTGFIKRDHFLLIDILPEDPSEASPDHDRDQLSAGSHSLMKDQRLLEAYAATAERFREQF